MATAEPIPVLLTVGTVGPTHIGTITIDGIEHASSSTALADLLDEAAREMRGNARRLRDGDQPLPVPTDGPGMHDLVIADLQPWNSSAHLRLAAELEKRRDLGMDRYGSLLQVHNGRDALRDLLEECIEGIVYARQAAIEGYDAAGLGIVERRLIAAATIAILLIDERDGTPTDPGTPRPPVRSDYPPESGTSTSIAAS
jgi:hypothetical protein